MRVLMVAAMAMLGGLLPAQAQAYPTRPIVMIVPFAAGGPSDAIARLLAQKMGDALKQQVVIENVPGAGGTTGTARLARSVPDGYTVLINDLALPAGALLNKSLTYDTLADLVPVGLVNAGPMVMIAKPDMGGKDAAAWFALLKEQPGRFTLGHSGVGSNSHLCGLLFQQALGIKLTEVPYRGAGPAMNDLIAGQIDTMCEQSTTAIPQIQAGKVRSYVVTSATRMPALPDLPTLAEAGVPGFEFTVWHGLYVPKGTPAEAIATLNAALQAALADPVAKQRYADAGRTEFPAERRSPKAHRAALEAEIAKLRGALEKAGALN